MSKIFSIIITYNGEKWLPECLRHLTESEVATQIVIVDNASTDNTIEIIKQYGNAIHFIQNLKNAGFGQANNIGMEYALNQGADFIFLINQDAYIFPGTIQLLTAALTTHPDFGILSPLQLDSSGKEVEPIFKKFLLKNFSNEVITNMLHPVNNSDINKPYTMRFVNAAAWMMPRECVEKVGLFHPVFFHYGEDNHYASRVQFHKMKIGVLPAARIIHDSDTPIIDNHLLLLRQIRTVPLYTLLDLRKPLPVAFFLGFLKWKRLAKKIRKFSDTNDMSFIYEQKKWFNKKLSEAIAIRKETSKEWKKIKRP